MTDGTVVQSLTSKLCLFLQHYVFLTSEKEFSSECVLFSDECSCYRVKYEHQSNGEHINKTDLPITMLVECTF